MLFKNMLKKRLINTNYFNTFITIGNEYYLRFQDILLKINDHWYPMIIFEGKYFLNIISPIGSRPLKVGGTDQTDLFYIPLTFFRTSEYRSIKFDTMHHKLNKTKNKLEKIL